MMYQEISNVELRTDESFRHQFDAAHHHQTSAFCELPIDLIKTFTIDYMHQCCLGVMRKLLITWLRGKSDVRISAGQAHQISEKFIALRRFVPKLSARTPRSLCEIDRWKATEFRLFLLYFGKFVLKGFINEDSFENFMTLSVAISILFSPTLANHVQRVSAKHGVKDDFAFLWEHAIFRHPPNKNPLTDRSEILHS
jgi:hypothetical protein